RHRERLPARFQLGLDDGVDHAAPVGDHIVRASADVDLDGGEADRDAHERPPTAYTGTLGARVLQRRRDDQHPADHAYPARSGVAREGDDGRRTSPSAGAALAPDVEAVLETSEPVDLGR